MADEERREVFDWFVTEDPTHWRSVRYDDAWYPFTAKITIDRPHEYNSYVLGTLKEICAGFERALSDPGVQTIVLTGSGNDAFCTGGNIGEYASRYTDSPNRFLEWGEYYGRVFDLILHCGMPVIARVNGTVAGGGWEFVSAADLAIATEDAQFIAPGPRVGMTSVGGLSQWLPLHMSHKKSAEIVLLSEEIDADTAVETGAINEAVPAAQLDDTVKSYVDRMNELAPSSLQYFKAQHNWWKDLVWRLTWEHGKSWFSRHIGGPEAGTGLSAFAAGSSPDMEKIRGDIRDGIDPSVPHGSNRMTCAECGTRYLPAASNYCLDCGADLSSTS